VRNTENTPASAESRCRGRNTHCTMDRLFLNGLSATTRVTTHQSTSQCPTYSDASITIIAICLKRESESLQVIHLSDLLHTPTTTSLKPHCWVRSIS
jgi:hypothetical protein